MSYNNLPQEQILRIQQEMTDCVRCPRLVEWREQAAKEKVKRFRDESYWGRPVPSFGEASARLLIIGLAPAAHGGNRTGRMFTGDRSGDWLYRALYRAGFANQPTSSHRGDGLMLTDGYISAVIHCAPPDNKPLPDEIHNCRPFLLAEIDHLRHVKVVVALGGLAFQTALASFGMTPLDSSPSARRRKPKFGHGTEVNLSDGIILIGSYHPSQQNTFTGRLTEAMLDRVFIRARAIVEDPRMIPD
jgi:uracil-DNA glycosylase